MSTPFSCIAVLASFTLFTPLLAEATITNANWTDFTSAWPNGPVNVMAVGASGTIYAGGAFSAVAGVTTHKIAQWTGSSWSALGLGMNGNSVNALVVDKSGNLYAGGSFTTAGGVSANNVAMWNGSAWVPLGAGMNGTVNALAFDGSGNLYAGGLFSNAGGVSASNVAVWNGSTWSALGTGVGWAVSALALDKTGNLYVGGGTSVVVGFGGAALAKWNGSTWSAVGSTGLPIILGQDGNVNSLAVDGSGNLYVAVRQNGAAGPGNSGTDRYLLEWNGSTWSVLFYDYNAGDSVSAVAVDEQGNVYMGGFFSTIGQTGGTITVNNIAMYDGYEWSALGSGTNGAVSHFITGPPARLYVLGGFSSAGGQAAVNLAYVTLPSPQIAVQEGGSNLTSGVSVVDFGSVIPGYTSTRTFTIKNNGSVTLILNAPTTGGANAANFTASPIDFSNGATFTVQFTPHSVGPLSGNVQITSNDPVTPTFTVLVTGTGSLATTSAASGVSSAWATLNGTVSSGGYKVVSTTWFQYGTSTGYGYNTATLDVPLNLVEGPVSFNVSGLTKGTTYHYRTVVDTGGTLYYGSDQTFTTSATPAPASWHSAQITALTNPNLNNMADGARTGAAHSSWNLYFYKGTDNNIWAVFLANGQWLQQQLTTKANVSDWLAFEPGYSILCYQGTDGNLWCVYYNSAAAQWATLQLGSPPQGVTVAGDIVVDSNGGWNNVYYRGSDGHLYGAYWNGSAWVHVSLGGTATVKGNLAVQGNNHLVYYQGTDNNLWCFYFTGKAWQQLQLTTTGNVGGSVAVDSAGLLAYYKSSTDNSAWCAYSAGGPWTSLQLDTSANMSASAGSFSNVAPYTVHDDTLYLDNNGQCNALYYNGSKWGHTVLGDGSANLTGGLSLQPVNHWAFARRGDGNIILFYYQ